MASNLSRCSFCDTPESAVGSLIRGSHQIGICVACAQRCLQIFKEHTALAQVAPCSFCDRTAAQIHLLRLGKDGSAICYDCGVAFGDSIREMEREVDELFATPETDEAYERRRS